MTFFYPKEKYTMTYKVASKQYDNLHIGKKEKNTKYPWVKVIASPPKANTNCITNSW